MEFFAAAIVALVFTLVFFYAFKTKGTWKKLWPVFIILPLAVWAAALWLSPVGPIYWGMALIPLSFIGLLIVLLFTAMPTYKKKRKNKSTTFRVFRDKYAIPIKKEYGSVSALGITVWIFICLFLLVVIVGYFFIAPAI